MEWSLRIFISEKCTVYETNLLKEYSHGRVLSPARPLGVHWTLDMCDGQTEAYTIAAWWSLGVSNCSVILGRRLSRLTLDRKAPRNVWGSLIPTLRSMQIGLLHRVRYMKATSIHPQTVPQAK